MFSRLYLLVVEPSGWKVTHRVGPITTITAPCLHVLHREPSTINKKYFHLSDTPFVGEIGRCVFVALMEANLSSRKAAGETHCKKRVLVICIWILTIVALVLGVEFLIRDGHLIWYCCDNTPKAAVPSSREQINIYRWWIRLHHSEVLVVDAGCGTGSVVDAICNSSTKGGVEVCGFDIDETCVEQARRVFPKHKFWVADMGNFQPLSDARAVCYIVYEPLWNCPSPAAWDVYNKFFTSIAAHGGRVSVVYVSGSGAFYPKPHIFDASCLVDLGFLHVYSRTIGSMFARRSCKIFTCDT